mgnify:CR=1 FL=1
MPFADTTTLLRSPTVGSLHALVADHVVQARIVFPGAGYLELARAAAVGGSTAMGAALRGVFFLQPLAVEAAGLHVECSVADGRFEVRSGEGDVRDSMLDATVHCSGTLAPISDGWPRTEHAPLRAHSCAHAAHVGALYDGFDAIGLQYGPGYRTLVQAWGGTADAASRLQARATHEGTQVHPADLDDALCAGALIASGTGGGETRLPFAVDDARLQGAPGELWAVRSRGPHTPSHAPRARLPILTPKPCCAQLVERQGADAASVRLGALTLHDLRTTRPVSE